MGEHFDSWRKGLWYCFRNGLKPWKNRVLSFFILIAILQTPQTTETCLWYQIGKHSNSAPLVYLSFSEYTNTLWSVLTHFPSAAMLVFTCSKSIWPSIRWLVVTAEDNDGWKPGEDSLTPLCKLTQATWLCKSYMPGACIRALTCITLFHSPNSPQRQVLFLCLFKDGQTVRGEGNWCWPRSHSYNHTFNFSK